VYVYAFLSCAAPARFVAAVKFHDGSFSPFLSMTLVFPVIRDDTIAMTLTPTSRNADPVIE